ncbi:hypothetical protein ACFZDK_48015 [Streptomyces sp. NPDC007901]|uniref:hypothetical protein n=1 Tax=Streptomyces sp. NPDC007901 TaxID=3364785 RepID=UPI0036EACC5C
MILLVAMMARTAAEGDRMARVALVIVLVFSAYALGHVIGLRSAKRSQSEPSKDPRSDAEDPVG